MSTCTYCCGTGQVPDDRDRVSELKEWCREHNYWVGPFDRVSEQVAATILNRNPRTLANWSHEGRNVASKKVRGRRFYSLTDLVAILEADNLE